MRSGIRHCCIGICLIILAQGMGFAKDVSFSLSVSRRKVGVGQPVQLGLAFNGTRDIPRFDLPVIEGFQSRYLGPSTSISIVNGQMTSSVTHMYTLLPTTVGTFTVGPFHFEYKGDTYTSNSVEMEVLTSAPQGASGGSDADEPVAQDLSDRVFMVLQLDQTSLYLNESVPLTIKLYVNHVGLRDIQMPQFAHEGFSVGEFAQPQQYEETVGGIRYQVVEFKTTIFGIKPGTFRIGPATMQCNLLVQRKSSRKFPSAFDDFFDSDFFSDVFNRYEVYPYTVTSRDVPITVLDLPQEGKPKGFSGALGSFSMEVRVSPQSVKVGDPVTVTTVVTGSGNLNTVQVPAIVSSEYLKAYDAQVKQENGAKTFEQVLIPLQTSVKEVPAVHLSFFNSTSGRYETISKGPFPLQVAQSDTKQSLTVVENPRPPTRSVPEEPLGKDILYIKEDIGTLHRKGEYLFNNRFFISLQVVPLLLFFLAWFGYKEMNRLQTDTRYARQLSAPRKAKAGILKAQQYLDRGDVKTFYDVLFTTLQEYLGDKLHLASQGITSSVIDEHLKDRNVPAGVLNALLEMFKECDMVRYASAGVGKEQMRVSLRRLEEIIDHFQRNRV